MRVVGYRIEADTGQYGIRVCVLERRSVDNKQSFAPATYVMRLIYGAARTPLFV